MSEGVRRPGNAWRFLVMLLILAQYSVFMTGICHAGIHDRVAAFVDNQAIPLSEFTLQYERTKRVSPDIAKEEVITTMINRLLLLREARKYRIEALSPEEIVREYIDLKIRAFIRVPESDIEDFYKKNITRFAGKDFEQVRDEIERYLMEKDLNERLRETIKGLRKDAYIRVQLVPE
ncbi:MAG: hypothetical protein M0Z79_05145 [Nitrospiraceae bacterium]|nr:hypothetical protein [Nitrospiraceae bacterium]